MVNNSENSELFPDPMHILTVTSLKTQSHSVPLWRKTKQETEINAGQACVTL